MAVVIVKNGKDDFRPFEETCLQCKSILKVVSIDDVEVEEHPGQGEMGGSTSVTFVCPVCGSEVDVPMNMRVVVIRLKKLR